MISWKKPGISNEIDQHYLTTGDLDIELQQIPDADYELCTVLLTAILRRAYRSIG